VTQPRVISHQDAVIHPVAPPRLGTLSSNFVHMATSSNTIFRDPAQPGRDLLVVEPRIGG